MSSTSTTKEESNPPAWAAGTYTALGKDLQDWYASGQGFDPYPGSTVAPYSGMTMGGINALDAAGQNWQTDQTRDQFQGLVSDAQNNPFAEIFKKGADGSLFKGQTSAAKDIRSLADKLFGGPGGLISEYSQPTNASENLAASARGDYLKEGNPYFNEMLGNELDDTAARVNSSVSGMGRLGSGAHAGLLADSLNDQRISAQSDQWNNERNWQLQSSNQIDAAEMARLAGKSGAAGQQVGAYESSAGLLNQLAGLQANMASAGSDAYGRGIEQGLAGTNAISQQDQQQFLNSLTGAGASLQAGGMLDAKAQAELDDYVNLWTAMENQPYDRMAAASALAGGVAGPYGVNTSRTKTSNPAAILGGLTGLFGKKG